MASQICPKCKAAAGKTAKFCKECGAFLADKPEPEAEPAVETFSGEMLDRLEGGSPKPETPPASPESDNPEVAMPAAEADDQTLPLFEEGERGCFIVEAVNGLAAGAKAVISEKHSVAIGADDAADLALTRDSHVSRQHASLTIQDGKLVLTDEDSTNGTFIRVRGRREVAAGDTVIVGKTILKIGREE